MYARMTTAMMLIAFSAMGVAAQEPDSLVAEFISRGTLSRWLPDQIFDHCPDMDNGQTKALELLLAARLSPRRSADLAAIWMTPLAECNDARLQQWYSDHVYSAIRDGHGDALLMRYWHGFRYTDSPWIRQLLDRILLDESLPESIRSTASATLFARLTPAERRREYLRVFTTGRMPAEMAWGQTTAVLRDDADALLAEVGGLVRADPALSDQMAFVQIVETAGDHASQAARTNFADILRDVLDGSGLTSAQRSRLQASLRRLARGGGHR